MSEKHGKYGKYFRDIERLKKLDIYRIFDLFGPLDHALEHAVKKLLLGGDRTGGKGQVVDVLEARDSLNRWLEMQAEDGIVTPGFEHLTVDWDKGERRIDTIAASAGDGEHYDTMFLPEDIVVPAGMKYISVLDNGQAVAHKKRPELFISGGTLCWHPQGENEYIGMVDARFGLYEHMSNHWQKIEGLE